MSRRKPRKTQQQLLQAVFASDACTQESYGYHLSALGMSGGKASVSDRVRGDLHMSVDELIELRNHLGGDAHVLLNALALPAGFVVVELPKGAADAGDVLRKALHLTSAVADVQQAIADMDEDGVREAHELASVKTLVEETQRELASILTSIQGGPRAVKAVS